MTSAPNADTPRTSLPAGSRGPAHDIEVAGDPLALPHLRPPAPGTPGTVADLVTLARAHSADRDAWAPLVRYDATSRWYHRLAATRTHEVWLLSWLPGQRTGWHDHGRSRGVYTVLTGRLSERTDTTRPHTRHPGTLVVLPPGHTHEVVNDSPAPAVSLHVYAPGLSEVTMHHPVASTHLSSEAPVSG